MMPPFEDSNVWLIRDNAKKHENQALGNDLSNDNYIDPSKPLIQEWLLELAILARNETSLQLHPQPTWIEAVKDFAVENGFGFPVPRELFTAIIELMKARSSYFRKLVEREIATKSPGITGDFLFTSLSVLSEVPVDYTSEDELNKWKTFTQKINEMLPDNLPPIDPQVRILLVAADIIPENLDFTHSSAVACVSLSERHLFGFTSHNCNS
jgi:hypothetical protein